MKRWWRESVLSSVAYGLGRAIGLTMRIRAIGWDDLEAIEGGKILAGWHGRTFLAANILKGRGVWTIISQSRDGEVQNRIFQKFGFKTIRGSTGRGGVRAAAESIRLLRDKGALMAITPDGPRGPTHVVQPGIVLIAKKSGAAIVPVGTSADRRWLLGTWDSYMIPKPFSRGVAIFGEPIYVGKDYDIEAARLLVEKRMKELEREAETFMGHGDSKEREAAR